MTCRACLALVAALLAIGAGDAPDASAAAPADAAYSAAFVSQSVPAFIEFLALTPVSVTMRNTGTATWFKAEGDVFLATQEPQDNYFWCIQDNPHGMYSGNRVLLPQDVAPGESVTFSFVVKPLGCVFTATAPFRFRMLSQAHGTFGEETPDPNVYLSTAAEFVSQQAPATAPAGANLRVSIAFKNTTLTSWSPGGYSLGSAGPAGNTTWGVASVPLAAAVAAGDTATFTFSITVPQTPGTYNFQWQMNAGGTPFGQASPATTITVVAAGPPNYGGLWWASPAGSEAGWGINFAHQGDAIFATWFTYDATGKGLWLTTSANLVADGQYSGTLLQTTGPAFDISPFRPEQVRIFTVGTVTLTFTDVNDGTFDYTLNGITQSKAITREIFDVQPTCTFDLTSDLTTAYNYQDLWWAAPAGSEPGWGINLTHQGDIVFATWFTYDHDGTPMWLSATAPKTGAGTYGGTLYRTTGPVFSAQPFDPAQVVATPVGPMTLAFTDGNTGTFSWTVDGESGSEAITREIFEPPGTVCQ